MPLRVLVVHPGPHFSVADVYNGWVKALKKAGVQVAGFPYDTRLQFYNNARMPDGAGGDKAAFSSEDAMRLANKDIHAVCFEFQPDVVLVVSGMFVADSTLALLRRRGITVVGLMTEQPYELGRELRMAEHCDLAILNDPVHLDKFRSVTDAYYQPHSYDPDLHHPGPGRPEWACDIAWVGTAFLSRLAFLDSVRWPTDSVRFGGMWAALPEGHRFERWLLDERDYCMDNDETADLYRSCRLSFNLYRAPDEDGGHGGGGEGWAMGPREVELAACGTFFLRHPRAEGDELFPMLPTFTTPGEFSELADYYLRHDAARTSMADRAREAVEPRTFDTAARRLLRILERRSQAA